MMFERALRSPAWIVAVIIGEAMMLMYIVWYARRCASVSEGVYRCSEDQEAEQYTKKATLILHKEGVFQHWEFVC